MRFLNFLLIYLLTYTPTTPKLYPGLCSSVVMRRGTDRHTDARDQYAFRVVCDSRVTVTNIRIILVMACSKIVCWLGRAHYGKTVKIWTSQYYGDLWLLAMIKEIHMFLAAMHLSRNQTTPNHSTMVLTENIFFKLMFCFKRFHLLRSSNINSA